MDINKLKENNDLSWLHIQSQPTIDIPYLDVKSERDGPTIVITAGMDGDEYASIEACFRLLNEWKEINFSGRRVLFPVVNIPGFSAGVSWNPFDKKLPKRIFPGDSNGTSSEQLISAIWSYIKPANLWIDMHGGARSESLRPYISGFKTNPINTERTLQILKCIDAPIKILDEWSKVQIMAKEGILYFLLESGEKGMILEEDINRHIVWTNQIIHTFLSTLNEKETLYKGPLEYIYASEDGYWQPNENLFDFDEDRMVVGTLYNKKTSIQQKIKKNSNILWYHTGGWVKQSEILVCFYS